MFRPSHPWFGLVAIVLAGAAIVGGSGCCVHRPGGPQDPCGHSIDGLRPLLGSRNGCGGCDSCGKGEWALCRWGCGDFYWDEWISDPPDCCDPCDDCGNWVGPQSCCKGGHLSRLASALWGCRGEPCSDGECCARAGGWCGNAGCADKGCADSGCTDHAVEWSEPAEVGPGAAPVPVPEESLPHAPPAPEPKAKRPSRPYHPSYTRPAAYRR